MPDTGARFEALLGAPTPVAPEAAEMALLVERLADARSIGEIVALVTPWVRALLQADGATFVLREGDRCVYADEDALAPLWKGRRFPMNACISGWCMLHRRPAAVPDIQRDGRIAQEAYRPTFVRSLAMVPVGRDNPVAALGAYWAEVRQIQASEVELLQAIAEIVEPAVARVQRQATDGAQAARPSRPSSAPSQGAAADAAAGAPVAGDERFSFSSLMVRLRRDGLRHNSIEAFAFAVLCVAVATFLRLGIGGFGVTHVTTFSTYYPAVLLSVLAGGVGPGLLAVGLGGLTAYLAFMPPVMQFVPLTATEAVNLGIYLGMGGLVVLMVHRYQARLAQLTVEDARHLTLAREQQHRLQNAVQVVEAIVRLTLKEEPGRVRVLNQRIRAALADIGVGHVAANRPIGLRQLFAEELEPFDLSRFDFEGDEAILVTADVRAIVTLAIHELATNALKYGALSVPAGRVHLASRVDGERTTIVWRESGGPPVSPPRKRGYGTALLHRLVDASQGSIRTEFDPAGVVASLSLPIGRRARR